MNEGNSKEFEPVNGLIYLDDYKLKGLTPEETEALYIEEAYKDLRDKGVEINPEEIEIVIHGAEATEEASDILQISYTAYKKAKQQEEVEIDKEIIPIYVDVDSNFNYIEIEYLKRFFSGDRYEEIIAQNSVKIPGVPGTFYQISEEDVEFLRTLQDKYKEEKGEDYPKPFELEFIPFQFEKKKTHGSEEVIILYKDTNDNDQVYASEEVLDRFEIPYTGEPIEIDGKRCHKITPSEDRLINLLAKQSEEPKMRVEYVNIHLEKHAKKSLDGIKRDLQADTLNKNDVKYYNYSNIKVFKTFKEELNSGNYLYNIVHAPVAVVHLATNAIKKLIGKIMLSKRAKETIEEIQSRLNNLNEEELETLWNEDKGSRAKQSMISPMDELVTTRIKEYGLKKVEELNEKIKGNYKTLFDALNQIEIYEKSIESEELTPEEVNKLRVEIDKLFKSAVMSIKNIREDRIEANKLLSSGVHGIEEDFKAVSTKLSYVGMRFAKKHDMDEEEIALQKKQGDLEDKLEQLLASGKDPRAIVDTFLAHEQTYRENTEIKNSIFGKRSIGRRYYSPLAEEFDYRDDPFIRDLITTIALTGATASFVNSLLVRQRINQMVAQHNGQINTANSHNALTEAQVHQTGMDIANKRGAFSEGMQAQAHSDVLSATNAGERASLDEAANLSGGGWGFNGTYHQLDHARHAASHSFYDQVHSDLTSIAGKVQSGAMTETQALEEISRVASKANREYVSAIDSYLPGIRAYAQAHGQHDLVSNIGTMEYLKAHPDVITNMNQSMVETVKLGESLSSVSIDQVAALSNLPDDMLGRIIGLASAATLAGAVQSKMKSGIKKGKYGNEVTQMMDDYFSKKEQDAEELEDMFAEEPVVPEEPSYTM